jgi:MFS superfamily sulfate permease-like transporter
VIINLLAETPHDVIYYWRSVLSFTPYAFLTFPRMRAWIDMALMLLTFFGTIIWNVEIGVLVSLVISLLLVVHRSSKTRMLILVSLFHPNTPSITLHSRHE